MPRCLLLCGLVLALAATGCDLAALKTPPPAPQAWRDRGQKLLAQYQCGSCHAIPGVASANGRVASSLQGFGERSYIAGRIANRADFLAQWIAQPQSLVPGTAMPSMGVSPEDARDMAAYLLELK